jgi:protease I
MAGILMIVAPENFSDPEYFEPKNIFEERGFPVTTASRITGEIRGSLGGMAISDIAFRMADPEEYEAVVLAGGKGAREYFEDRKLHDLLRQFHGKGKITAAICISPVVLANAGLLEGRKATVWNDEELIEILKEKGASYTGLAVTLDGNIITASGPKAAREFGQEIVNLLKEGSDKR